ncbi:cytochrome b/b6 domain-containing protein [Thermodesulfobacteriota bacterium]
MKMVATRLPLANPIALFVVAIAAFFLMFHGWAPAIAQQTQEAAKPEAEKPSTVTQPTASAPAPPAETAKPAEKAPKPAEAAAQPTEAKPAPAATEKKPEAAKEKAEPEPAEEKESEEEGADEEKGEGVSNAECMECHNSDILEQSKEDLADQVEVGDEPKPAKKKPPFVFGELNLSIDPKKYEESVHGETTCVECHQDVSEVPHLQRLKVVDCAECHDDAVESINAGVHGTKAGPKDPRCIGCHNAHYGKGKDEYAKDWKKKVCVDCHKANKMDTMAAHSKLYEFEMHMGHGCMFCHQGKEPGVHNIPAVKVTVAKCEDCHNKTTILAATKKKPKSFTEYVLHADFINKDALKKYGHVIGAHRIPLLDTILILLVVSPLVLPIFHGGLRIIKRRKGPLELPDEKILLHPLLERLWHWLQALCIVLLIITGIVLHWPEAFSKGWFQWAVDWHNWFGWALVILFLFWLIYNLVTGRISHYIPKKGEIPKGVIVQAKFYGYGIFKHDPHPYAPSEENKFNPLQKIAYLKFQLLMLPLLLITGLLYMYPKAFSGIIAAIGGLHVLAVIHLILGALFAAFLVAHLYLATTGETVSENFKAIITGYGIKEEHGDHGDTKKV